MSEERVLHERTAVRTLPARYTYCHVLQRHSKNAVLIGHSTPNGETKSYGATLVVRMVRMAMERYRTQATILVVEDYADSRAMLKLLLENRGYTVFTAANGKDALAI